MTGPAMPRYQALAITLIGRIERGEHALGRLLPTEQELCAEFGVSRHTVREALRLLAAQGYVRRRQGSGSEVIADRPRAGYRHSMRSLSELFEYAEDTELVFSEIAMVTADEALAARLGRRPGRAWLRAEGVRHTRSGTPLAGARVYLHEDFAPLAADLPLHKGPVYPLIEERFGARVAEVAQEITAGAFPQGIAAALGLAADAMAIRVTRRYLDASDQPLIVAFNWHPAETFSYAMRLRREEGAGEGRGESSGGAAVGE
ncbi:MAG: GntR family transcriptional regulator [Pseudomonadota bacterium]